jgi:hypothetical protein
VCYTLTCVFVYREESHVLYRRRSVITGLLNAYLVREHASEKVRESYTRISEGLQSRVLTRDDYVWLENALLFLRPYWWNDREDGRMLMDALLHTQTLARRVQ